MKACPATIACLLSLTLLVGCFTHLPGPTISPGQVLQLPAPEPETWEAIQAVLGTTPLRSSDRLERIIRTDWVEGWSERRFGLLGGSWRRRYRLTIRLDPSTKQTQVAVAAEVEERAPAGRLALRWERIPSDGSIERDFLHRLRDHVAQADP